MRLVKDEELEKALYMWYVQKRGSQWATANKPKQLNDMLSCTTPAFTASAGWLW